MSCYYVGDRVSLALFGIFLIIVGGITYLSPGILQDAADFFRDFAGSFVSQKRRFSGLPWPSRPHSLFYVGLADFFALFGIAATSAIGLRIWARQHPRSVINVLSGAVFFIGMAPVLWSLESGLLEFTLLYPLLVLLCGIVVLGRAVSYAIIGRSKK